MTDTCTDTRTDTCNTYAIEIPWYTEDTELVYKGPWHGGPIHKEWLKENTDVIVGKFVQWLGTMGLNDKVESADFHMGTFYDVEVRGGDNSSIVIIKTSGDPIVLPPQPILVHDRCTIKVGIYAGKQATMIKIRPTPNPKGRPFTFVIAGKPMTYRRDQIEIISRDDMKTRLSSWGWDGPRAAKNMETTNRISNIGIIKLAGYNMSSELKCSVWADPLVNTTWWAGLPDDIQLWTTKSQPICCQADAVATWARTKPTKGARN
jgi:hypothetical protein